MRSLAAHISHHAVLRHMEPGLNIDHFFYMEYTHPALKRDQDIMGAVSLNDVLNSTKSIEKSFNICYEKKVKFERIRYDLMPCNTIIHDTIRYDTIRYDTIRYDTIRYDTIRYDTIRYDTTRYDTIRYETIRYDV